MMLTERELERYDRQIRLLNFGVEGQSRLKAAKILVAGVGGLGSAAALYLAAAGVGKLVLVDKESIELSNLNRQILYTTDDLGKPKAKVAANRLSSLNPEISIEAITVEINEDNVSELIKGCDVVMDGQDNYKTRYVLNDACIAQRIPFVHASVHAYEGRLMTILPGKGPCYRCLVPVPPPEGRGFPILGTVPGTISTLQATEAIKIVLGIGKLCVGRLLVYDALEMKFHEIKVERNPECSSCGLL
ncbi:MAG: HesA/MoeB/ThiF family protein [Nitrososphaerota archaeon]|nr:HesA/MoeB/ThiF family protein [Aigarchaeota archaeon]MDW8076214.1 HesA/MoeB/ThiF family protein [Nitrososphaerota archaeon]